MEDLTRAAKHYFEAGNDKYKLQLAHQTGESMEELYIRVAKISIRKCNACRAILAGFYFCCTECEFYDGYSLCVNCFYDGTVKHQHDSFADNHSILTMVKKGSRNPPCEIHKDKGKAKQDLQIVAIKPYCTSPPAETMILEGRKMVDNEGMDKLARIAKAHHKAASREIKNAADTFCRNMFRQAGNGQSRLTQNDYLAVMIKMRYPQYADRELFQMLAKDGNHMTMSEALTLYYIVLSGRPFCSGCEHFIPDMFFCCSKCPAAKYALCLGCYESEAYLRHKRNKHFGENDVFFLDYTVLHNGCYSAAPTPQSPNLHTYDEPRPDEPTNAIVKKDKGKELVATFSTVLTACTAALNFGAAFCTIM